MSHISTDGIIIWQAPRSYQATGDPSGALCCLFCVCVIGLIISKDLINPHVICNSMDIVKKYWYRIVLQNTMIYHQIDILSHPTRLTTSFKITFCAVLRCVTTL